MTTPDRDLPSPQPGSKEQKHLKGQIRFAAVARMSGHKIVHVAAEYFVRETAAAVVVTATELKGGTGLWGSCILAASVFIVALHRELRKEGKQGDD